MNQDPLPRAPTVPARLRLAGRVLRTAAPPGTPRVYRLPAETWLLYAQAPTAHGLQNGVRHLLRLPDGTELSSGTFAGAALRAFTLTEAVNDESELTPGAACAACVTAELWCPGDVPVTAGQEFACYRLRGEERELLGLFTAEKPTRTTANTCRLTAYDRMARTDVDLSPWLRAQQGSFPMPLQKFARAVCAQCGLELTGDVLPNGTYPVPAFYADGLTGRRLLQWIGQVAGRFCRITPNGKLEFAWYIPAPTGRSATPDGGTRPVLLRLAGRVLRAAGPRAYRLAVGQWWYYQDTLHYEDFATRPIDAVRLRQTESDVGVLWPAQPAGSNVLVLTGNLLLGGAQRDLLAVAQTLYEQLKDVTYTPCRVEVPAGSGLRAGMVLPVEDRTGRHFVTYITDCVLQGGTAALTGTGHATRGASTAVYQRSLRNQAGRMLEIEAGVDGLKVKASELSGAYTELTATVDGISSTVTKNKADVDKSLGELQADYTSKIEQTAESITTTVRATYATKTALSTVQQTADKISWLVKSGTSAADFTLTDRAARLAAESIDLSGFVTFTSLKTAGQTTIHGSNLQTGTVTAGKLSLKDLSETQATLGSWTLSATRIRSSASITAGAKEAGLMLINEAGKPYLYAQNASGQQTFAIDRAGNAAFAGSLNAATGTFAGELQAATGSFSGSVEAAGGHIAGWRITNQSIDNGTPYTGACDSDATGVGGYGGGWAFWAGNGRFSVNQAGHLHAQDADITGTIRATDGYFAGTVYANRIAVGGEHGYITGDQIGGASITGGNIGAATITGGNIGGGTVTRGNLKEKYVTDAEFGSITADMATFRNFYAGSATAGNLLCESINPGILYVGNKRAYWKTITVGGKSFQVLADTT